jgi:hypothetical protein
MPSCQSCRPVSAATADRSIYTAGAILLLRQLAFRPGCRAGIALSVVATCREAWLRMLYISWQGAILVTRVSGQLARELAAQWRP